MHPDEYAAARSLLERAGHAASEPDESYLKAVALLYLGRLAFAWGDYDEAREPLDRAIAIVRSARPQGLILPLVARARLARAQGERELAGSLLEEALSLARGDGVGPARALLAMGDLATGDGTPDAARELYEEALELARRDQEREHEAQALEGLARLARAKGGPEQANRLQSAALRLRHELREERGASVSTEATARLGFSTDRLIEAAHLFGAASELR